MSEWQSMSTAPKDGTPVLVAYLHEDGDKYVTIASWVEVYDPVPWHDEEAYTSDDLSAWVERGEEIPYGEPTHWMPLPDVTAS
jgi:hypothetical protein